MVVGENVESTEVVVIGGGPGGYAAAFHAADLGKQVALVDQEERLGGVCLLRGCIPSKALISAAELLQRVKTADKMGIRVGSVSLDMPRLIGWKNSVIEDLSKGIDGLAKGRNVRRFTGRAVFRSHSEIFIDTKPESTSLRFQTAVIAVGTRPIVPQPFQRGERIITSDEALDLTELPKDLLVVGGGYIGMELGTCFAALGSKVTIVELLDQLLMGTDVDLVREVRKHLDKQEVKVHLESKVTEATVKGNKVHVKVEPKEGQPWTGQFDRVLVAIGRRPNTDDLGLERAGVKVNDKGFIDIDKQCRTSVKNIFAIGDCSGPPALAHRARRQGMVAAEVIAGKQAEYDNRTVPAVVFSDPEIAYCGMSEAEAKKAGYKVKTGRFRFAASGRAKTLNQVEGLVTIIAEEESEVVLGVRMVGPHVSELIGEATLAVETAATLEDLIATIHVHPTLTESIQEAAEAVRGHAIHSVRATRKS
jgi:dihydrolipoamide dehydrogenase